MLIKIIYYKMLTMDMSEYNEGTTIPSLRTETLYRIELDIPDKETQKRVIEILDPLEQKIELNNEINNNLFNLVLNDFNDFLDKNIDAEIVKLEDCVEKINTGADAIQRAPIVDYNTGIRCIRIGDMTNGRDYHGWGFTKMTDKDFYG